MKRSIAGNRETSYRRIFAGYLASLGVTAVCLVLPEFSRPVMLSAILMLGVGNIELSLCSGLFFCSLLGLLCGGTIQEFSMYILLVLIGAVAADAVENSKKQFWYEWFAGMAGMLLPVLFYYLTYREISVRIMVSAVADGVVVFLFLHLCYRKLADARNAEVDEVMVDITDESYPLARELVPGLGDALAEAEACPASGCRYPGLEALRLGKRVELTGFPGTPRVDVYLAVEGVGDELPELRFFRLRDMLDTPLQTGTARHVLLGETATALDAETSFTVFDLLEGMGWELGFQGGSLTCNLKE